MDCNFCGPHESLFQEKDARIAALEKELNLRQERLLEIARDADRGWKKLDNMVDLEKQNADLRRRLEKWEKFETAKDVNKYIQDLEKECMEQARLNGMGSEREAALMAKLERTEKDLAETTSLLDGETKIVNELQDATREWADKLEAKQSALEVLARQHDGVLRERDELRKACKLMDTGPCDCGGDAPCQCGYGAAREFYLSIVPAKPESNEKLREKVWRFNVREILDRALENCGCSIKERLSGHLLECNALIIQEAINELYVPPKIEPKDSAPGKPEGKGNTSPCPDCGEFFVMFHSCKKSTPEAPTDKNIIECPDCKSLIKLDVLRTGGAGKA